MPCVLVELFFIDNPEEANKLSQPEFRKALAQGLYEGIHEVEIAIGKVSG